MSPLNAIDVEFSQHILDRLDLENALNRRVDFEKLHCRVNSLKAFRLLHTVQELFKDLWTKSHHSIATLLSNRESAEELRDDFEVFLIADH